MKRRRLLGPLIGIAAGTIVVVVFFVVAELSMRLSGVRPKGDLVFDSARCYVGWGAHAEEHETHPTGRLRDDTATDEQGFRVAAPGTHAATGARCRVLCTGDSFTEGVWVPAEAAYPAVMGHELRARGLSVDIFNAGMRGHTISDERVEILGRWRGLRADVVIVQQTANDLDDLIRLMRGGCEVGSGPPFAIRSDLPPWLERTATVGWLRRHGHRLSFGVPAPRRSYDRVVATPDECDRAAAEYQREAVDLADETRRAGSRLVFAFVEPFFCTVPEPQRWDARTFTERFERAVAERGARVLHIEDALSATDATLRPADSHPSAAGHRSIASRIVDDLVASGSLAHCGAR